MIKSGKRHFYPLDSNLFERLKDHSSHFQRDDMSLDEAVALMKEALRVLYYRDKTSINKYVLAKVTGADGVAISKPFALDTKWDLKAFINPSKHAVGSW